MTISAREVQELRKISGAGMMECKVALSEANGDVKTAFNILREKGIAKAEKKSSRDANEGLVGVKIHDNVATIIEINTETDFVSRNSEFHQLMNDILSISINNINDIEKVKDESKELISQAVGKIGENIVLNRIDTIQGHIFSYVHNSVAKNLGKIGVLLSLEPNGKISEKIGKNLCMHIAASSPKSIYRDNLDVTLVENERAIIQKQLKDSGKPDNIVEKMISGKLNKFYEEVVLMEQKFVIDPTISIKDYLQNVSSEIGQEITINNFIKFEIAS